jgi:hypothetical protein
VKVTRVIHESNRVDGVLSETVSIKVERGEDWDGMLERLWDGLPLDNGEWRHTRLEALLTVLASMGRPGRVNVPAAFIRRFGVVAQQIEQTIPAAMWYARDTLGLSWEEIGGAFGRPPATARRLVIDHRDQQANEGRWRDREGLHQGMPEEAETADLDVANEEDHRPPAGSS